MSRDTDRGQSQGKDQGGRGGRSGGLQRFQEWGIIAMKKCKKNVLIIYAPLWPLGYKLPWCEILSGFLSFPCPERGGKGGGDFLFKAPDGPLFGSPFGGRCILVTFKTERTVEIMNQEQHMEQLRQLYQDKTDLLETYLEPVEPHEFYREIFPEGSFERKGRYEDEKGNGIAVTISQPGRGIALEIEQEGKVKRYTITDDLDTLRELQDTDFTIISPISYFGKRRCGKNARYLYALVFDLDGVDMPRLRDTLHQMDREIIPKATFVVNSGTGLHLYYVLKEPVPMYPQNQKYLKELKYALTRQIWNKFTSTIKEPQMQGVMQGFRVIGSGTKLGRDYPVRAYRLGEPVELDELIEFVPDSNGEQQRIKGIMQKSGMSLEEAKKKYPDWFERRVVRKEKRGRWVVKRDLYDWWLHRIRDEIKVGHRFYGIMTLAIYAKKCGIDEDELRQDAFSLLRPYDDMSIESINRFTQDDVICALEMFNEDYVTFPRDDIAKLSGLSMPVNKRNGRKRAQHLEWCRIIQNASDIVDGTNWRSGNGRPSKREKIAQYMREHPEIKNKSEIARALNISRPTVVKYYDEIRCEIERGEGQL